MPYMVEGPLSHSPLSLGATFHFVGGVDRHQIRDSRTLSIFIRCKNQSSRYVVSARVPKIALMKPFRHTKQHATNSKSTEGGRALIWRSSPTTPATLAASDADCSFLLRCFLKNTSFSPTLGVTKCLVGQTLPGNKTFVTDWMILSKPSFAVTQINPRISLSNSFTCSIGLNRAQPK